MAAKPSKLARPHPEGYFEQSKRPLHALLFLLPLLVGYELGLVLLGEDRDIVARLMLGRFFEFMGVDVSASAAGHTLSLLPPLIVVAVLLSWHVAQRDPWRFRPWVYLKMLGESLALTLPLLVLAMASLRQPMQAVAGTPAEPSLKAQLLFSIGAGIYEELLFRLIGIALLHMLLVDVAGLRHRTGAAIAIGLSALAFGLYHFESLEAVVFGRLLFYTAAGVYFATVYLLRGFGIVAGVHALYDVLVFAIAAAIRQ